MRLREWRFCSEQDKNRMGQESRRDTGIYLELLTIPLKYVNITLWMKNILLASLMLKVVEWY